MADDEMTQSDDSETDEPAEPEKKIAAEHIPRLTQTDKNRKKKKNRK